MKKTYAPTRDQEKSTGLSIEEVPVLIVECANIVATAAAGVGIMVVARGRGGKGVYGALWWC